MNKNTKKKPYYAGSAGSVRSAPDGHQDKRLLFAQYGPTRFHTIGDYAADPVLGKKGPIGRGADSLAVGRFYRLLNKLCHVPEQLRQRNDPIKTQNNAPSKEWDGVGRSKIVFGGRKLWGPPRKGPIPSAGNSETWPV